MKQPGLLLTTALLFLLPVAAEAADRYPVHPDFTVTADGQPLRVWRGTVATETSFHPRPYHNETKDVGFVLLDLARPVEIEIRVARPVISAVAIKPDRAGITPSVQGDVIRFKLDRPGNFIVELNHSAFDHLYIFANPPERDAPSPGDPNVIYFGPGVHDAGLIDIKRDGQTVYLAAGAVVRGRIHARNRHGTVIRGRGILDAVSEPDKSNPILFENCEDGQIRDIVILNARGWTIRLNDSRRLHLENIREICSHQNSDGIDPLNCEDVTIRNCFIRNYDDGVVVKAMHGGSSRRITAEGCIVITDHASSLKIGANETMGREINDITFRDCDLFHSCATQHLAIMDQGTALISNVRFEDIRIENGRVNLMGVKSGQRQEAVWLFQVTVRDKNAYMTRNGESFTPGSIRDVVFKNITYKKDTDDGGVYHSSILGLNAAHTVSNVTFENVVINGRPIVDATSGSFEVNPFAEGIKFLSK